jgi:hypothetical protein
MFQCCAGSNLPRMAWVCELFTIDPFPACLCLAWPDVCIYEFRDFCGDIDCTVVSVISFVLPFKFASINYFSFNFEIFSCYDILVYTSFLAPVCTDPPAVLLPGLVFVNPPSFNANFNYSTFFPPVCIDPRIPVFSGLAVKGPPISQVNCIDFACNHVSDLIFGDDLHIQCYPFDPGIMCSDNLNINFSTDFDLEYTFLLHNIANIDFTSLFPVNCGVKSFYNFNDHVAHSVFYHLFNNCNYFNCDVYISALLFLLLCTLLLASCLLLYFRFLVIFHLLLVQL